MFIYIYMYIYYSYTDNKNHKNKKYVKNEATIAQFEGKSLNTTESIFNMQL